MVWSQNFNLESIDAVLDCIIYMIWHQRYVRQEHRFFMKTELDHLNPIWLVTQGSILEYFLSYITVGKVFASPQLLLKIAVWQAAYNASQLVELLSSAKAFPTKRMGFNWLRMQCHDFLQTHDYAVTWKPEEAQNYGIASLSHLHNLLQVLMGIKQLTVFCSREF